MNKDALLIPRDKLGSEFKERAQRRKDLLAARDSDFGKDRIHISSYMENIGWPELLGFDMNDFFADPDLSFDLQLRQKMFWADNSVDDTPLDTMITSDTGVYFDTTLFGTKIFHNSIGVPEFEPHPISVNPDPASIASFDFYSTGDMPALIKRYKKLRDISETEHSGYFPVDFPAFHRGPLDIYVQLRGYENFLVDTMENPELVHIFLDFFVSERLRYRQEREIFLEDEGQTASPWVADDWVNIPFISPSIFNEFVLPAYRKIVDNEGAVVKFHTCGRMEPVVGELLEVFPEMKRLDVSGWNDVLVLDDIVPHHIAFDVNMINTFTLCAPQDEQKKKLEQIAKVASHREVTVCAQAIVKLLPTYDETLARMNSFIELARATFASKLKGNR